MLDVYIQCSYESLALRELRAHHASLHNTLLILLQILYT